MKDNPQDSIDVSIVIPVRNGEEFIIKCIESVLENLDNTLNCEIVISENYSTDGTFKELLKFKNPEVRLLKPNQPLSAAENWNFVSASAKGKYVKLLCADDLLSPNSLKNEVKVLEQNPKVLATIAPRVIIGPRGKFVSQRFPLRRNRGVQDFDRLLKKSFLAGTNIFGEPGCVLFRTSVFSANLPWSDELPYVIDLDFYSRAFKNESIYVMREPTSYFRIHQGSVTSLLSKKQSNDFMKLLNRHTYVFQANSTFYLVLFYIQIRAKFNQLVRNFVYLIASRYR
jgi:glycosyltransferase involved in cell wall biosynthesis